LILDKWLNGLIGTILKLREESDYECNVEFGGVSSILYGSYIEWAYWIVSIISQISYSYYIALYLTKLSCFIRNSAL
jgi:hypothetical protein